VRRSHQGYVRLSAFLERGVSGPPGLAPSTKLERHIARAKQTPQPITGAIGRCSGSVNSSPAILGEPPHSERPDHMRRLVRLTSN
jgi:hypothetical protein